jgi:hypothetical protein
MRIRATAAAAVLCGTATLSAAAIPAAQASGVTAAHVPGAAAQRLATSALSTGVQDDGGPQGFKPLDVTFSKIVLGDGKPVVVGTTKAVHISYSFTITAGATAHAGSQYFMTGADIYRGSADDPSTDLSGDDPATCKTTSASGVTPVVQACKGTIDIDPTSGELSDSDAGTGWHGVAYAFDFTGADLDDPDPSDVGLADQTGLSSPAVQRYSRLTVNASPEPVRKNHSVTVTGALTRANWETNKYAGYTKQKVALQFRKKGSTTYKTLKTVTTDSHGGLKTTYKATTSGYWRYLFAGTSTTPAVKATGDYVKVS